MPGRRGRRAVADPQRALPIRPGDEQVEAGLRRALRSAPNSRALARAVLHVLGNGCRARAGAFYLMRGGQVLELAAHTGQGWPGEVPAQVKLGEGPAGLAATRRSLMTEPAPGAAGAACFTAVPYHLTGRIKGVAVFLLDRPPDEAELAFLAGTIEPVAIALDSRRSRERVQLLLEETRRQAEAHAAQQAELEQANARLQRSDRYKNEFLANMTHELRSPLNSMLLLSQVLTENRHGHLAADEVDAAQVINKAGRELLVIIDDILDLTKAEAGRLELHPGTVQVSDLAESLAGLYRPLAARRGLELRIAVDPDTPAACRTDATRLSQVLKNLLNNALKFTERGSVSLTIRPSAAQLDGAPALDFVVADTGIGIGADVLPALFEAFTQADGSIARRFGGSGLGLSICRKLAELLCGRILVASEPGRGSTFTFRVPLELPERAAAPRPAGSVDEDILALPAPVAILGPVAGGPREPARAPGEAARPSRADETRRAAGGEAAAAGEPLLAGQAILVLDGDMRTAFRLTASFEAAGARVRVERDAAAGLARLAEAPAPGLALVRPELLLPLTGPAQREWWARAGAAGTRLVVLSALVPASLWVPAGLPVLDPDQPAARICRSLAGLASAPARTRELPPGLPQEVGS